VDCFTVPQDELAELMLVGRAQKKKTRLIFIPRHPDLETGEVKLGLQGDFQKDNASLAAAVTAQHLRKLKVGHVPEDITSAGQLPKEFVSGLAAAEWEGRCEIRREKNIEWYIDGAHTMDSLAVAAQWFAKDALLTSDSNSRVVLIFNQQVRDAPALLEHLLDRLTKELGTTAVFHFAVFTTNSPYKAPERATWKMESKSLYPQQWALYDKFIDVHKTASAMVHGSVEEAVDCIRANAGDDDQGLTKVLVTGSLHLVGALLQVLEGHHDLA